MQPDDSRRRFVNLAVSDLARSMQFIRALGFDQAVADREMAALLPMKKNDLAAVERAAAGTHNA